jgi:predicted nucleic acid-binding protein
MINTFGGKSAIVDADALIGLIHETDALHSSCLKIAKYLHRRKFLLFIPYPIVLEAATTLAKDKTIKRPDLAARLLKDYATVEKTFFDTQVGEAVAEIYQSKTSKKNTPFDYYVLACARKNNIKLVFSFDSFYEKNGLVLLKNVVK